MDKEGKKTMLPSIEPRIREKIDSYFAYFNEGNYNRIGELFGERGILKAPFARPVTGRTRIYQYFQVEAPSMKVYPEKYTYRFLEGDFYGYKVRGRVETPTYNIGVNWEFVFNGQLEIALVKVELLATLEELLMIKPPVPMMEAA